MVKDLLLRTLALLVECVFNVKNYHVKCEYHARIIKFHSIVSLVRVIDQNAKLIPVALIHNYVTRALLVEYVFNVKF